jgi:hypothetical protein
MARWWLLKKRVRLAVVMYGEYPAWTVGRCWAEAGDIQRWSLQILAQIQEGDREQAVFAAQVEATLNQLPVKEVSA